MADSLHRSRSLQCHSHSPRRQPGGGSSCPSTLYSLPASFLASAFHGTAAHEVASVNFSRLNLAHLFLANSPVKFCMCLFVHVHVCACICACVPLCVCLRACVCTHLCVPLCVHLCASMSVCVSLCVFVCVPVCVSLNKNAAASHVGLRTNSVSISKAIKLSKLPQTEPQQDAGVPMEPLQGGDRAPTERQFACFPAQEMTPTSQLRSVSLKCPPMGSLTKAPCL